MRVGSGEAFAKLQPMADEVFASLPQAVLALGMRYGLTPGELLEAAGLEPEQMADRDAMVPYETLPLMWERILERHPQEPLGLRYAEMLDFEVGGVVGYVCRHARTIGDSFEVYLRFSKLLDPRMVVGVERVDGLVRATVDHEPRVVDMAEPMEMMLVSFVKLTEKSVGRALPVLEVCFRHPQKHDESLYAEVFHDAPVRFDAPYCGVTFPSEVLDIPFRDSDPSIRRYLEAHCEHLLSEIEAAETPQPIDAQVREHLDELLMRGEADIEHVAKRLAMSTRSLQRALKSVGTSFREQLDEVRRGRSLLLLKQPSLSVQEIAFMLGYADPRNFYRSFKRWTDTTPTAFRREH